MLGYATIAQQPPERLVRLHFIYFSLLSGLGIPGRWTCSGNYRDRPFLFQESTFQPLNLPQFSPRIRQRIKHIADKTPEGVVFDKLFVNVRIVPVPFFTYTSNTFSTSSP